MSSPTVTGFSAFDVAVARQMWVDSTGNTGYYLRQETVASVLSIVLVKVDLTSPVVLATGPGFPIGTFPNYYIREDFAPVSGYPISSKLWVAGVDSLVRSTMYSFNSTTLAIVDQVTVSDLVGSGVQAMTGDGLTYAAYNSAGDGIFLFNTSSHSFHSYTFASVGGPSNNINFIFDKANNLWAFGDDGSFWTWPVTQGSPPGLGMATSYPSGLGATGPGQVDYNPDTDTITAWALRSGTDYWVITINATTHAIGPANTYTSNWSTTYPDLGSAQMHIWTTSDYVGVVNADGDGFGAIVGIYQRSTGTTTYYPWSFWGRGEPIDIVLSEISTSQDGQNILGITGVTPNSGGDGFEDWMFRFGSSPPPAPGDGPRFFALLGPIQIGPSGPDG